MKAKERIMKDLLNLPASDRNEILAFFGYKPKAKKGKRLKEGDPMLSVDYHLEKIKRKLTLKKIMP